MNMKNIVLEIDIETVPFWREKTSNLKPQMIKSPIYPFLLRNERGERDV
jgi:hypothetical protein